MIWDDKLKQISKLNKGEIVSEILKLGEMPELFFESGIELIKGMRSRDGDYADKFQNTLVGYHGLLIQDICDCPEWNSHAVKKFGKITTKKNRVISSLVDIYEELKNEQ